MDLEKFKNAIIKDINDSGLPIGVVYYIFKDINHMIENEYNTFLAMNTKIQPTETVEIKEEEE